MADPLLRMTGISKRFPGVVALDGVDFEVARGEIHALLGENGAGKSTLLKILSGAQQADVGNMMFAGLLIAPSTPHDAQEIGIATIYQEFTLAPNMTIAENVFLGREPGRGPFVSWRRMAAQTKEATRQLGLDLRPTAVVRNLAVAEQQMVEIARALSMDSQLIVMDEPTSALSSTEVGKLFAIIRDLRARGLSVIFVTHRLEEVLDLCDSYTVLRDGRRVGGGTVKDTTVDEMIRLMVGRDVDVSTVRRGERKRGAVALRVESLCRRGNTQDQNATVLDNVSFEIHGGEVLGWLD